MASDGTIKRARRTAAVKTGQSIGSVARKEKTSKKNVRRSVQRGEATLAKHPQVERDFCTLLGQFVTEIMETNIALLRKIREPEYIEKQNPADLGQLIGTLNTNGAAVLAGLAGLYQQQRENEPMAGGTG